MRHIHLLLSTSLLGCAIVAQPAYAADAASPASPGAAAPSTDASTIQEIIVTAERRFNSAQKTAAAISVRTGEDLLLQGRYELKNILEDVPGITGGASASVNTSTAGGTDNPATGLFFRGILSNSGVGGSATSTSAAAAIYVDDVYNGIGGSYDINRVEVLRGPQGTLYGRSATAGVVAIHTGDPDAEKFGVEGTAEIGDYNLRHFTGDVNVPIVAGKLAFRGSGNYFARDGYYSAQGDARSTEEFRGKLLWTPTDNFSALVGYAQQYNVNHTGGVSITQGTGPEDFQFAPSAVGTGRNHFRQYWANFNLDLGGVAITYIPAYRTWYQNVTAVVRNALPGPNIDNYVTTPSDTFLTQELRIHSTDNSAKFKWQAGFLYYRNALSETNSLFNYNIPPAGIFVFQESEHKATTEEGIFAEGTYAFTPDTRLTAGIRYDHTEVNVDETYTGFTGITGTLPSDLAKFDNVTYKARIEHDLTAQNMLYAAIATGFSPGDQSLTQDIMGNPQTQILKAETLTAYEIGSKNRFLQNHLQFNVAAFYNDYAGYQSAGINIAPAGSPLRIFQTLTVPVTTYGVEVELQARPWTNGTFGVNGSYTHARYGTFDPIAAPYFSTHTIAPVPPVQITASYDHRIPIGSAMLALHGALRYRSEHDSSRITVQQAADGGTPYIRVPGEVLADFNATLLFGNNVSLTGYVRNLTNRRFLPDNWNVADVLPGAPGGPPVVIVSASMLSDPRTFGAVLTFKY